MNEKEASRSTFGFIDHKFSNHMAASMVLHDLDIEAQLLAIHFLLDNNNKIDQVERSRIAEFQQHVELMKGIDAAIGADHLNDQFHDSVYRDAAYSMAAIGMLGPFFESFFSSAFGGLKAQFSSQGIHPPNHIRWDNDSTKQWDCRLHWGEGKKQPGIAKGILELINATGLKPFLPNTLELLLPAIFEYRNKMFHCGFEWPQDQRIEFETKIQSIGCPDEWFDQASKGDEPWVFYMSSSLVQLCLSSIDETIEGLGKFCNETLFDNDAAN